MRIVEAETIDRHRLRSFVVAAWHSEQVVAHGERRARTAGSNRLWLTTTNDNLDALRFYQRRGFRLVVLRAGAVEQARRTIKPELPEVGSYGIPMRDEVDLELRLARS